MSSIQNISTKFESTSRQSAEVTAALAGFNTPNAVEAYDRLQAIETATVKAATAKQNAARIAEETTSAYETLRKNVRLLRRVRQHLRDSRPRLGRVLHRRRPR